MKTQRAYNITQKLQRERKVAIGLTCLLAIVNSSEANNDSIRCSFTADIIKTPLFSFLKDTHNHEA